MYRALLYVTMAAQTVESGIEGLLQRPATPPFQLHQTARVPKINFKKKLLGV
jgi:hypothetical protein